MVSKKWSMNNLVIEVEIAIVIEIEIEIATAIATSMATLSMNPVSPLI